MADVRDVASYILQIASASAEEGELISNLKLQKLIYYCQGFSLALANRPLFSAEIEHWTHGPVCPDIYHLYKQHGSNPIPAPVDFDAEASLTADERELIENVYSTYGQFAAWRLREMTHEESPWLNSREAGTISLASMKEYFDTQVV